MFYDVSMQGLYMYKNLVFWLGCLQILENCIQLVTSE